MRKFLTFSLTFSLLFFCVSITTIGAQGSGLTSEGILVSLKDEGAVEGNLVCSDSGGFVLCKNEYDSSIYGIINNSPSTDVSIGNLTNPQMIVFKGDVNVKVTSANGNIKAGNFLTTSKTPGVAQLSDKQGFVIGTALEDYSSDDKNAVGQIKVSMNIHANTSVTGNTRQNLIELLRNGLSGLGVDPISALRYILASLVVLVSLVVGLVYFGRVAKTGVEAVGRNPLAGIRIEFSVIINIAIMIAMTLAGLGIAYLILAL